MTRIHVAVPEKFLFRMEKTVGLSDINYAKHLDSVSIVKILHEARLQVLASLGFTEANVYGLGLVVTDLSVDYISESFANDRLIIDVGVSKFTRHGFDIGFKVSNKALETIVCNGNFGLVFFDFDKHQLASVPSGFEEKLGCSNFQEKVKAKVA